MKPKYKQKSIPVEFKAEPVKSVPEENAEQTMMKLSSEIEERLLTVAGKPGYNPYFAIGKLREAVANKDWRKVKELEFETGKVNV